jgi:GR25 family glycosyltransferase involved in LPS biosynthesis
MESKQYPRYFIESVENSPFKNKAIYVLPQKNGAFKWFLLTDRRMIETSLTEKLMMVYVNDGLYREISKSEYCLLVNC